MEVNKPVKAIFQIALRQDAGMELITEFSRPPKVVIADDDWMNRDLLKTYLVDAGCEVLAFPDGEQAWANIQETQPDLALLDIDKNEF